MLAMNQIIYSTKYFVGPFEFVGLISNSMQSISLAKIFRDLRFFSYIFIQNIHTLLRTLFMAYFFTIPYCCTCLHMAYFLY